MAFKDSYLANGLETRVHGNRKRLQSGCTKGAAIQRVNVMNLMTDACDNNR